MWICRQSFLSSEYNCCPVPCCGGSFTTYAPDPIHNAILKSINCFKNKKFGTKMMKQQGKSHYQLTTDGTNLIDRHKQDVGEGVRHLLAPKTTKPHTMTTFLWTHCKPALNLPNMHPMCPLLRRSHKCSSRAVISSPFFHHWPSYCFPSAHPCCFDLWYCWLSAYALASYKLQCTMLGIHWLVGNTPCCTSFPTRVTFIDVCKDPMVNGKNATWLLLSFPLGYLLFALFLIPLCQHVLVLRSNDKVFAPPGVGLEQQ